MSSKLFWIASSLFVFTSVQALATPVPPDKLSAYQKAVQYSLAQHPLTCVFTPSTDYFVSGGLSDTIGQTTSVDLDETAQPLLTFHGGDATNNWSVAITTTNDDKTVTSATVNQNECSMQEVNVGTIENPQMVQQQTCTVAATATCQ